MRAQVNVWAPSVKGQYTWLRSAKCHTTSFQAHTHTHSYKNNSVQNQCTYSFSAHVCSAAQNISTHSNNIIWCYKVICNSYILRIEMHQFHHCNAKLWAMDI